MAVNRVTNGATNRATNGATNRATNGATNRATNGATNRATKNKFNFETAIESLEVIVEEMEAGDLTLEAAMSQFEKGVKLTRECHKALQDAEQKVKILLEKQGNFELIDFATDEIEDPDNDE